MAKKEASPYQITLKNVRLLFPKIWTPEALEEGQKKKYGAMFGLDPDTPHGKANLKLVKSKIEELKLETWKDKADKIKIKDDRLCLVDGNDMTNQESGEVYDGCADMMIVSAKNEKQFPRVDRNRNPVTEADDVLYPGCYVNAVVRLYVVTDQKKGGNGIFASLEAIQYFAKGDRFGGKPVDADDVFDELGDEDDEDDPLA
ncbi:putative DNA replication protein [Achromobacter phage vB_AchrS_AchV4]|uniref:Putative DNA replication protein n=1 Tax=Achromobacter phage vB_AchrS_AchV4 TaxID=2796514 RepID=A0A7T3PGW3_9CAUD|nr:putative DNA replication protein [Achromobacter phage vB_AchrS_AchV4]QPZ53269.1 putative DNA replication protein [Achromobacter phage vB_AchrS_AchV4]